MEITEITNMPENTQEITGIAEITYIAENHRNHKNTEIVEDHRNHKNI